jgi:polyphosphate kinase
MDAGNPLLERLKFLAITASNLDEFFMVRVGGLSMARKAGLRRKDPSGLTPLAQLRAIEERTRRMMNEMNECFNDAVSPGLAQGGIRHVSIADLTAEQERVLSDLFHEELFPVITPIAVSPDEPFPQLPNLAMQLLVHLRRHDAKDGSDDRFAVLSLDRTGERIIPLPAESGYEYVRRGEVVKKYAANWFPGYDVRETALFRITRNADFAVREEMAPDLLSGMEDVLEARKYGECVRLEIEAGISKTLLKFLSARIPADAEQIYLIDGVLNLRDFMTVSFMEGYDAMKVEAWPPQPSPAVMPNEPMFDQIARSDLLLNHPYETYDPVVRFIEEAAVDPDTMAIKMVLYRTSSQSAIISALKRAAENGVNVTVLMELKARFDEARNMDWARDLEQCGVQVVYGVKGYKTHAKICLVVRREPAGVVRYCHCGTGNYNESTARLYGDISYMTCNPDLGADASAFFNALCGYAQPRQFNLISMAPINMRDRIIELIDFETERARKGKKALIRAKVNSLVDPLLIRKLYESSKAGVRIELNVRGICCLKPDGNIAVKSIVDRYLEHARIVHFHHAGKPKVYIASADWMPRNLDKRLELMVPVEHASSRDRLIRMLEIYMQDNQKSWMLQKNGAYKRVESDGRQKIRSQKILYDQACEAIGEAQRSRRTRFEPHRASGSEV